MPNIELTGIIVDFDPNSPVKAAPSTDGLYLQTDGGKLIELITDFMARQISVGVMWRESRGDFEPYLGKQVTVGGYLSGRTLYSAHIVNARD
jgi:hypothetical protein